MFGAIGNDLLRWDTICSRYDKFSVTISYGLSVAIMNQD